MQRFDLARVLQLPELPAWLGRVEAAMAEATHTDVVLLQAPLARLLRRRGKRLRPSLVLATTTDTAPTDDAIRCAAAIELVHLATLVHDDIMDKSATRWGEPTIWQQEGADAALLVGDYLLAKACAIAGTVSPAAGSIIAHTIARLCEGQARETADVHNVARSEAEYLATIRNKTAALMSAACRLGALCAGHSATDTQALAEYGQAFGMAFQLIDDTLDIFANPALTGKPTGTDIRAGVYTLPFLYALRDEQAAPLKTLLEEANPEQAQLVALIYKGAGVAQTEAAIHAYHEQAARALARCDAGTPAGLHQLPQAYWQWASAMLPPDAATAQHL